MRGLLAAGLRRTRSYRSFGALFMIAVPAAVFTAYFLHPPSGSDRIALPGLLLFFLLMGGAGAFGLLLAYQAVTAGTRHAVLLRLLADDPSAITRIYGANIVRTSQYSGSVRPIPAAQEARSGRRGRALVVIQRRETHRIRRALGLNSESIRVRAADVPDLLRFLRELAPNALGAPERTKSPKRAM